MGRRVILFLRRETTCARLLALRFVPFRNLNPAETGLTPQCESSLAR